MRPMGSLRLWVFLGLAAAAAGLMVTSAIMPWWSCTIDHHHLYAPNTLKIFQYGIPSSVILALEDIIIEEYPALTGHITPFYQIVLAWVYIAVSVGLILFSTYLKGRGRWLLGGIGLVFIVYAVIAAFVVMAGGLGEFGISLQGISEIETEAEEGEWIIINAALRFGYYLAYAAGGMCIALALFRNKIVGKTKPGA
jgi:hypothetical protein